MVVHVQMHSNDHLLVAHQMIERRGNDTHCHAYTIEGQLGHHKSPYADDTREIFLPTCNQLQNVDRSLAEF
jgi:hypothetical protein